MKKLPIGIQSFEDLIRNDYIYLDKTGYIYRLAHYGKVYFLSRPRRFGKSLLLSAMEAYFEGKRELFSGLEIEKLEDGGENPWTVYPVIKIDMAGGMYTEDGGLEDTLRNSMRLCAESYGIGYHEIEAGTVSSIFENLIRALNKKTSRQVVVLIDEYDKPLLDNMASNPELEERNRGILKGYYGQLKKQDEFIKFIFVTGVTKFSKVSIFSDLNQMNDISLNPDYSTICGITEKEMVSAFQSEIDELSENIGSTKDECIGMLRDFYDGYHFSNAGDGVYNPFSLINAFFNNRIGMYWFSTGTPTFLVKSMKENDYSLEDLKKGVGEDSDIMSGTLYDEFDFLQLLYQSGYITIKNYEGGIYSLGFPNREVEFGFEKALVPYVLQGRPNKRLMLIDKMANELNEGDAHLFMNELKALFASIPYAEGQEPYLEREWRNQMYLIFRLLGQRVSAEVHSSHGRCDAVVDTGKIIYIFEFKQDRSPEEALKQIEDMGYALPYISSGKSIVKIGANFSTKERTLDGWEIV